MDIYELASSRILEKLKNYLKEVHNVDLPDSAICTVPPTTEFGELATNSAMVLARALRRSPRQIAEELLPQITSIDFVKSAEIAGPGFINIRFKEAFWDEFLNAVIEDGFSFGDVVKDNPERINVEFVSANPTGPLHVGHCRGAILGNSIANILKKAGYSVTKEYYVNDHGNQIANLLDSVQYRYMQQCGLRLDEPVPDNCYPGAYITDFAKELFSQYGDQYKNTSREEFYALFKKATVDHMLDLIRDNLNGLGIVFDLFTSETDLVDQGKVDASLDRLKEMNLIYKGKIPRPVEAIQEDEEYEVEQLLFKSSAFGDTSDRVVVKADGELTYFASDIAYHYDKYQRGFSRLIDIWGADHIGYIPRMQSALAAITESKAKLDVLLCQMVNLEKDGEPFKMSKRAGTYVLLTDVLEEIDPDIFKIYMLSRNPESQVTFDLVKLSREAQGSVVFYIQYAFARTNSLLSKYKEVFGKEYVEERVSNFYENASIEERKLLNSIASFPSILRTSADKLVTHLIVNYISELSGLFHSYWNTGRKIIDADNEELSRKNLALITAVRNTLGSGLSALGVEPRAFMSKK